MTTGIFHDPNLEKEIEKQMGCMTGFLQIFDRHHILSGIRLNAGKRLPSSPAVDSTSQSEGSMASPAYSRELQLQQQQQQLRSSPECTKYSTPGICSLASDSIETPGRMPLPFPVFEFKEGLRSSWKFKEAPRLSLDSRATFDGKGSLYPREIRANAAIISVTRCEGSSETTNADENEKQRRSPSVIARLMGLEALPDFVREPPKKVELRRSASESRVSRDLLQYRFIDGNNCQQKQLYQSNSGSNVSRSAIRDNAALKDKKSKVRTPDSKDFCARLPKSEPSKAPDGRGLSPSPRRTQQQRKGFFDSQDFFPEAKQTGFLYGEIEKRLKMRGIDEPTKDLEALKQILEALQLKGLLHSKRPEEQISQRNFVYDLKLYAEESPVVVMKSSRSISGAGRPGTDSPNVRSKVEIRRHLNFAGETLHPVRPRRDRTEIDRNLQNERRARNTRSPDRNETGAKTPNSLPRRKPLSIDTQRGANDSAKRRRSSPTHSRRINTRKVGSDQTTSRSPRNKKPTPEISSKERISSATEDESSTISESSISTASQVDPESLRSKMVDCNEGRSLLERCDKLLHSIAEITPTEWQPSPVSVLDSSFYKDESSPSPVMKRCIDFKDYPVELEDENWNRAISPVRLKFEDKSDDRDFLYVSEIFRASDCLSEDCDIFLLLEKQQQKANSSEVSKLHRKLVFDTIREIIDRKRQFPAWTALSRTDSMIGKPSLKQVWSEFCRIRERAPAEDVFDVICGVLQKDMAGDAINGWRDCPAEISEAVLDIERLIFKDLVAETIRDLAFFAGKSRAPAPRRMLVF